MVKSTHSIPVTVCSSTVRSRTAMRREPAYLSRLFKKVEGVNPTQFRKSWRGK